ncbi:MAG: type II secretion system F family protein [Desulfobia sp.]
MGLYKYSALDKANLVKQGILEAADKEEGASKLMNQGLRPLQIDSYREKRRNRLNLRLKLVNPKISKSDINFFTSQVTLLLKAGLSLDNSLRVMRRNSQKEVFQEFVGSLERKLKEGKSFSEALSDYPYFSSMYINIVRAGEEGGILPEMLTRIAQYQATFRELKQFIISASVYPLFLLVLGFIAIIILITTILPRFEMLFEGMNQQLPANVQILMSLSGFISDHLLMVLAALFLPSAVVFHYLRTERGRRFFECWAVKIPGLARFIQGLETTRIFRTLEALVKNGVHLATALRITSGVVVNHLYREMLNQATEALKQGHRISDRLKGSDLLPDMAVDLLSIGEESGRVGEVCGQIADHYDQELRNRVKRMISLVEPLFILFIALVVGYIVISMLSVILSINSIAG